ncbi:mitochondrial tRNA-specific 2-thiouridylase 1 isoform X2 [Rhodnius prolixus]
MKNWDLLDETGICSVEKDLIDAVYICDKLGISFHEVNFVKHYWNEVFSELIQDYEMGLTPNPDILCNKRIKFNHFFDFAIKHLGCDAIATGHYAQSSYGGNFEKCPELGVKLYKALDQNKDQTFFLSQIPQHALKRTIFPLGVLTKNKVKSIAFENKLEKIASKKESMGMCFIGNRNFKRFIEDYIKPQRGNLLDVDSGKVIGTHFGKHTWTIGQRCNLGGLKQPYYIAQKSSNQDIWAAIGHNHPTLYTNSLTTDKPYWIYQEPFELSSSRIMVCDFRFQHREPLVNCSVLKLYNGGLHIVLQSYLRAVTPGQYAVFYKGQECLGSAKILSPGPSQRSCGIR